MAVFNINTDLLNNFDSEEDIKKVKSYLYRLNDQLQYMFSNMTVDDNFSADATTEYAELVKSSGDYRGEISILENQIQLKVSHSELGNSSLTIKPAAITIESGGTIDIKAGSTFTVDAENFSIDELGNVTGKFEECCTADKCVDMFSRSNGGLLGAVDGTITIGSAAPGSVSHNIDAIIDYTNCYFTDYMYESEEGTIVSEDTGRTYKSLVSTLEDFEIRIHNLEQSQ